MYKCFKYKTYTKKEAHNKHYKAQYSKSKEVSENILSTLYLFIQSLVVLK